MAKKGITGGDGRARSTLGRAPDRLNCASRIMWERRPDYMIVREFLGDAKISDPSDDDLRNLIQKDWLPGISHGDRDLQMWMLLGVDEASWKEDQNKLHKQARAATDDDDDLDPLTLQVQCYGERIRNYLAESNGLLARLKKCDADRLARVILGEKYYPEQPLEAILDMVKGGGEFWLDRVNYEHWKSQEILYFHEVVVLGLGHDPNLIDEECIEYEIPDCLFRNDYIENISRLRRMEGAGLVDASTKSNELLEKINKFSLPHLDSMTSLPGNNGAAAQRENNNLKKVLYSVVLNKYNYGESRNKGDVVSDIVAYIEANFHFELSSQAVSRYLREGNALVGKRKIEKLKKIR